MEVQYITSTVNGIYKYRRKTPKELYNYIKKKEIVKSLGKNLQEAYRMANEYTANITEALELCNLSSIPQDIKLNLIHQKLSVFLSFDKPKVDTTEKKFKEIVELYLNSLAVSFEKYRDRKTILTTVYPAVFKVILKSANPKLDSITHQDLIKVRDIFACLPKRNIKDYRKTPLELMVKRIIKGEQIVEDEEDYISLTTQNIYLKTLSSVFIFAMKHDLAHANPANGLTIKQKVQARDQRKSLTLDELEIMDKAFSIHPLYPLFKILRYTGMRTSEILKCQLKEIDGVLCFDLRSPKKPLKTFSSYRVIPVHNELKDYIDNFQDLYSCYSPKHLSKYFRITLRKLIKDTQGKSLYSLRHTFATQLIAKGVASEIVSELMGHSHNTMTMNRYVKGYPIAVLKEAIDRL